VGNVDRTIQAIFQYNLETKYKKHNASCQEIYQEDLDKLRVINKICNKNQIIIMKRTNNLLYHNCRLWDKKLI